MSTVENGDARTRAKLGGGGSEPGTAADGRAPNSGPTYPIASVDKALRLIVALSERRKMRLSEVSEFLDAADSTAHRMLAMLVHHGFVRQDADSKFYSEGPVLVRVGLAALAHMDIRSYARPVMERLKAETGETVHLAILEGDSVRYLDCLESDKAVRVVSRVGAVLPAHTTSVGKALLAALNPAEFRRLYPTGVRLSGSTPNSIRELEVLERELASVRRAGYATNHGESEEGVASVAVAVLDHTGRAVGTISVAAPSSRLGARRARALATLLIERSAELTESLPF